MRKIITALLITSAIFTGGCRPRTFETELKEILQKEYGKSEEEAEVAVVKGERDLFLKKAEVGKKEAWLPNYHSVTLKEKIEQTQKMSEDLDKLLSYQNKAMSKYVDEAGIRGQLEHDEKIIQFNLQRMRFASLYEDFTNAMGLQDSERKKVPIVTESMLVYPLANLEQNLIFDAVYVQVARGSGRLVPFDDLGFSYNFEMEIPNPGYPNSDPVNQTIWIPKSVSVHILSYDTDYPKDHRPDYIEVFRTGEDKPAIKIFHSINSPTLDVAVVDTDKRGEQGHGIPDEVMRVMHVQKAIDVYELRKDLLVKIFQEKKKLERTRPITKEMAVAIARVGDLNDDYWEYDTKKGFSVPLDYQAKGGKNYTLAYGLCPSQDGNMTLAWVAKRWKAANAHDVVGRVVSYHRVLPAYKDKVVAVDIDDFGHRLAITRKGQADVAGLDSLFIEEEPYRISYDWGSSRWIIEDKDNNKIPKYEARYEQEKPLWHELDTLRKSLCPE